VVKGVKFENLRNARDPPEAVLGASVFHFGEITIPGETIP